MNRQQRMVTAGLGIVVLVSVIALIWVIIGDGGAGQEPDIVDEQDHYQVTDGRLSVNGTAVMNDSGFVESDTTVQLSRGDYITDLSLFGAYEGNMFFFGQYPLESSAPKMELGPDIQQGDAVLEGYMIGRLIGPQDAPSLHVDIYYDDAFLGATGDPSLVVWNVDDGTVDAYDYRQERVDTGLYHVTFVTNQTDRFEFGTGTSDANIMFGDVVVEDDRAVTGQFVMGLR